MVENLRICLILKEVENFQFALFPVVLRDGSGASLGHRVVGCLWESGYEAGRKDAKTVGLGQAMKLCLANAQWLARRGSLT